MSQHTRDTPAHRLTRREFHLLRSRENAKQSYQSWRKTIPWTDAEIVAALKEHAEEQVVPYLKERRQKDADFFERTGKLTRYLVLLVLPLLIKKCTLCGKKALYRTGTEGRCREHRMVPAETDKQRRQRIEEKAKNIAEVKKGMDTRDLGLQHLRDAQISRRRGHK